MNGRPLHSGSIGIEHHQFSIYFRKASSQPSLIKRLGDGLPAATTSCGKSIEGTVAWHTGNTDHGNR
jgi:hypothetical protein